MITIFFATQTGNAEYCANALLKNLQARGLTCQVVNLAKYRAPKLSEEKVALFLISTFGEGEPPDDATSFSESLDDLTPGSLAGLNYAVFALGDTAYTLFCGFANQCDHALREAGATQLLKVEKCDLDHDDKLPGWADTIAPLLADLVPASA